MRKIAYLLSLLAGVVLFAEGISINQDDSNYYMAYVPASPDLEYSLSVDGLKHFADHYCQGQAKEVIFCANCQKVPYATQTRFDTTWTNCEFTEDGRILYKGTALEGTVKNYALYSKMLSDRGINQFVVWFDHIRSRGYSPWVSMRMNDMHGGTPQDYFTNEFWATHPELRWGQGGTGLDYAQPEVQKYAMELVHEYLTLFDVDGIEIDWTRFPLSLRPGHYLADAPKITDFMRRVRQEADAAAARLGHPVKVGARVFSRPDESLELGYDFRAWVKEKLVDMLVPTNFWPTTDSDMPMETWRQLVGPDVTLGAGLDCCWTCISEPADLYPTTKEMVYGYAAQFWHRGCDRLYIYNFMAETEKRVPDVKEVLSTAGSPETAYAAHRRHIVTFCVSAPNQPKYTTIPAEVLASKSWRLNVGGGTKGRHAMVILGIQPKENNLEKLSVSINGVKCTDVDETPEWFELKPRYRVTGEQRKLMVRRIPLDALQDGYNDIRLDNDGSPVTVNWVEILLD